MDKPLVSIILVTYNQERYVRDSVRGILAQNYEPLEIIISDDCSKDATWAIVSDEVVQYRQSGGVHKNIILNRNEQNLGIAKHCEKVFAMTHGELIIASAGDDISMPNRVSAIVEAWVNSGKKCHYIYHLGVQIDLDNNVIGPAFRENDIFRPSGAASAYNRSVISEFNRIALQGAYEDWVYATRAMILGDLHGLQIDQELIKYRIGSGVSDSYFDYRAAKIKSCYGIIASFEQAEIDLESWKNRMPHERYEFINGYVQNMLAYQRNLLTLASSSTFSERFRAWEKMPRAKKKVDSISRLFCLLPRNLGDALFRLSATIKKAL